MSDPTLPKDRCNICHEIVYTPTIFVFTVMLTGLSAGCDPVHVLADDGSVLAACTWIDDTVLCLKNRCPAGITYVPVQKDDTFVRCLPADAGPRVSP